MLSVKDLRFSYDDVPVLNGISFDAEPNTIISILGPNGTGKTTLLKCLCNLHRPQSGSITIDGKDILSMPGREIAKHIGFVPQSTQPTRATVFDTALIGRKPHMDWSMSKKDYDITWDVLKSMKLDHLALRKTNEISGGEFQKVQIARAIIQEPEVLILDEPSNNLDISNQHRTMHAIMDFVSSRGMCTIMTMHDINLAVHYSNKLMFIKDGKVAAYGEKKIVTEELIQEVYGIESEIIYHKGVPLVVPRESLMYDAGDHDIHDHLVSKEERSVDDSGSQ